MRKNLLLVLLGVLLSWTSMQVSAQDTLTVANGTAVNEYVPIYGFYCDSYIRSQSIYPESMLAALSGKTITGLQYHLSSSSNTNWGVQFSVSMVMVNDSVFSSTTFDSLTNASVVYTGLVTVTNNLLTFTFDNPFVYTGGNLLIDFTSQNLGDYANINYTGISRTSASLQGYTYYSSVSSITPSYCHFLPKTSFIYLDSISCAFPQNLVISNVSDQSATLGWTAGGSESQWDLVLNTTGIAPDSTTTLDYVATTNTFTFSNLNASTQYYAYVRANCGSGEVSSWSSVSFITSQIATTLPYSCDFEDTVENAQWVLYNNGYTNRWHIDTAENHTNNGSYALYISYDNGATYSYDNSSTSYVWAYRDIDFSTGYSEYSLSFDFKGVGESTYDYMSVYVGTPATVSGNNAPAGATLLEQYVNQESDWVTKTYILNSSYTGVQRLYFLWVNDNSYGNNPPACIDNIQVEGINCGTPYNLVLDSIAQTTLDFHFTAASVNDNAWEAIILASGDTIDETQVVTLSDTVYQFTNLDPNTYYTVYVRTNCGSESSFWSTGLSARTDCPDYITTLPFTENFDTYTAGYGLYLSCWSRLSSSSTLTYPYLATTNSSAPNSLYFYAGTSGTYSMAITPQFDASIDIDSLQLTFKYRAVNATDRMLVGVMTDPTDYSTFVVVDTVYPGATASTWIEREVNFNSYTGTGKYIAFKHEYSTTYSYSYIDDVNIHELPSCVKPQAFTATNVTQTAVTLSWSEQGTATAWNLEYGPSGFVPGQGQGTPVQALADTFTVTNLSVMTYDFYVQADCGGSYSDWTGPVSVTPGSYNLPTTGWDTAYVCNAYIYDDGGLSGTYSGNCDGYMVLYPEDTTKVLSLSGFIYAEEAAYDYLVIYDGDYASTANELFRSTQTTSVTQTFGPISSTSGPLTIYFHSDGYIHYDGFVIQTTCVSCAPPTLTVNSIGTDNASISWTNDNGTQTTWQIVYGVAGFSPDTVTPETVITNSYTLSNLMSNTSYEIYVRTDCGDGSYSVWSSATSIHTLNSLAAQVPYFCNFEDGTENAAWSIENSTQTNQWYIGQPTSLTDSVLFISNTGTAATYNKTSSASVWAYRDFTFDQAAEFNLSFKWMCYGEPGWDYLRVFIGTPVEVTAGSYSTPMGAVQLGSDLTSQSAWQYFSQTLDASYANTTQRIYFLWRNDGSGGTDPAAVLDSIQITATNCGRPYNVTASNVGSYTADINFQAAMSTDIEWQYVLTTGTNPDGETPITITDTTATLTGLTPETTYHVYVRTSCGSGEYSNWSTVATFTTLVACAAPTNLTVSAITTNTAEVSWVENGTSTEWTIEYGVAGFTPGTGTSGTASNIASYSLSGLTAATQYDLYVTAVCSATETSSSVMTTFSTACDAINTFPYTEGFENGGNMPTCWSQEYVTGSVNWTFTTGTESAGGVSTAHGGTFNACMFNTALTNYTTKLISPVFDLTNVTNPYLSYWYTQAAWGDDQDRLTVYYRTSATDTWHQLAQYLNSVTSWTMDSLELPSPSSTYQLAFEGITAYGYGITLDDITIASGAGTTPTDTCPAPTGLTATTVENETVTLTWSQEANTADSWQVEYREQGATTWNTMVATTVPYTLTGLTGLTTYEIQVLANCTNGLISDPSNMITVTTTNTGISDYDLESRVRVYPNPTVGKVTITAESQMECVNVYDVYGKLIQTLKVEDTSAEVDMSSYAAGVYFVRIQTDNGLVTKRVVKR